MTRLLTFSGTDYQDPSPSWRWLAYMPNLPAGPQLKTLGVKRNLTSGGSTTDVGFAKIYVEEFEEPVPQVDSNPRFQGGRSYYFPRFYTPSTLQCSFKEDHSQSVYRYLMTWQSLVVDPHGCYYSEPFRNSVSQVGNGNNPSYYWQDILFENYGILSNTRPLRRILLKNCWPSQIQPIQWSYEGSTYQKIAVTFACNGLQPSV